jgi:hypothetical protein
LTQAGFVEKDWKMEGGNVEVDQTPLQNQLKKNKECKFPRIGNSF